MTIEVARMCNGCVGLCNYCDCRGYPVMNRLWAEHTAIQRATDVVCATLEAGEPTEQPIVELIALIDQHGSFEEDALFQELHAEGGVEEKLTDLHREHRALRRALGNAAAGRLDPPAVLAVLDQLRQHIRREEYGLFPAAILLLGQDAWDRLDAELGSDEELGISA